MHSSDTPPYVEQAIPMIAPEAAQDIAIVHEEKPDIAHLNKWPLNPYATTAHPMFARAVFPKSAFIGPVRKMAFGLCGLAPDRPSLHKKEPALEAAFGRVIVLSDALAATGKTRVRPNGVSIH